MTGAAASFFVVALLLTISPGPDTVLVLRTSISQGRAAGIASAVGVSTGVLLWALASALGISALLAASSLAYDALRLAGAAYLCWLGAQALAGRRPAGASTGRAGGRRVSLRTGLATNLLNPKVGVFYLTVLPGFIPPGGNVVVASLLLAGIHIGLGMCWLALVAWSADRAQALLRKDSARRRIDAVTGGVLIAFGVRTALTSR